VAFVRDPSTDELVALPPCTQEFDTATGALKYLGGAGPLPGELAERAVAIARRAAECVPGLHGYFGVDVLLGECDLAIEINPRLTTSYLGLRYLTGWNIAARLLGQFLPTSQWRGVRFRAVGEVQESAEP